MNEPKMEDIQGDRHRHGHETEFMEEFLHKLGRRFSEELCSDAATLFPRKQLEPSQGSCGSPMHRKAQLDEPWSSAKCGMALKSVVSAAVEEEKGAECFYMEERFWIGAVVTIPLLLIAMRGYIPGNWLVYLASATSYQWMELAFATPVVLWAGWPFLLRAWRSVVEKSFSIFTLMGIVVSVVYIYSLVAVVFPDIYPASFRGGDGTVPVYFEAAAVIVLLGLLGMVLQLRRPARPALP